MRILRMRCTPGTNHNHCRAYQVLCLLIPYRIPGTKITRTNFQGNFLDSGQIANKNVERCVYEDGRISSAIYQNPYYSRVYTISDGCRRRKQDGRYFVKYRPLESSYRIFTVFPVLQKIEYRYFVSVFLGIPQHRITVYDGISTGIVSVT